MVKCSILDVLTGFWIRIWRRKSEHDKFLHRYYCHKNISLEKETATSRIDVEKCLTKFFCFIGQIRNMKSKKTFQKFLKEKVPIQLGGIISNWTALYGSRYSRMVQVKVFKKLCSTNFTWSILECLDPYEHDLFCISCRFRPSSFSMFFLLIIRYQMVVSFTLIFLFLKIYCFLFHFSDYIFSWI